MCKYISGSINCTIEFHDVYIDEGDDNLDGIFPEGWEGEMTDYNFDITEEYYDKE